MRYDDPLITWLMLYGDDKLTEIDENSAIRQLRAKIHLSGIHLKKDDLTSDFDGAYNWFLNFIEKKSPGSTFDQKKILEMIASVASPASIPFWKKLLGLNRSRDSFSNMRRTYALAALALLEIRTDEHDAWEALKAALNHSRPEARAMAAHYIKCVYVGTQRPASEDVASVLTHLATKDRSFAPRFMARRTLAAIKQPVPLDHPAGVYTFKVWHQWDEGVFRVIELKSEQTLDDLHLAIQDAWNWGNDHLFAFYLNGKRYDERYEFGHDYVDGAATFAIDATIGELGLKPRHKFLYYFDFGDSHQFWVVVTRIREEAGPGSFPRIVESVGEAIEQYPAWEE